MSGDLKWWQGDQAHKNLAELAGWMSDGGCRMYYVLRMLEKPWHYDDEYQEMRAAQQATREDWSSVDR